MAKHNYLEYIQGRSEVALKKYLYVLRPLACIRWLYAHGNPAPTALGDVLAGIELPNDVRNRLRELIVRKRDLREMGTQPPEQMLDAFVVHELEDAQSRIIELADPIMDTATLNGLLWEIMGL
jgi:predicted nucleotidyltransferase